MLASLGSEVLQGSVQLRIVGQDTIAEVAAHGISAVSLAQHDALMV